MKVISLRGKEVLMKRTVPSDVTGEIKSLVLEQESQSIEKQKLPLSHASAMMLLLRVRE